MRSRSEVAGQAFTRGIFAVLLLVAAVQSEAVADESVEAEQLLQEGKASAAGGELKVQPMASFGPDWSGDAQLFWTAPGPGAVLDLKFKVPKNSRWAVDLELTLAPDYGEIQLEVDGKPVIDQIETFDIGPDGKAKFQMLNRVLTWNGYAASVTKAAPVLLQGISLDSGEHRLSVMVVGRDERSTNYYVGIDRLVLHRLPPGRTN